MMTRNFCIWNTINEFLSFSTFNWCHHYTSVKTTVFYTNICCFIITVLSGLLDWCQDWYNFNNSTPKTTITRKDLGDLLYMLSYSLFCVKFCCHGNGGQSWYNFLSSLNSQTPKTTAMCKDLGDISYTNWVSLFCLKFLCHCIRGWSWWSPTPKPHGRCKNLSDICYTSLVIVDFVPNSLPWQQRSVTLNFLWQHWIAQPQKLPIGSRNSKISLILAEL